MLPDDSNTLIDALNTDILSAKKEIFILTPAISEYTTVRSLKKLSKKNIPITIISNIPQNDKNKISHLSLLNNISIFTLKSFANEDIKSSFICVDDKKYYHLSNSLNQAKLKETHAFATFSKGSCTHFFKTLIKRCQPY